MASSKLFIISALFFFAFASANANDIQDVERFFDHHKFQGLGQIKHHIFRPGGCHCAGHQVCAGGRGFARKCVTPMKQGGRCGQDPYWVCSRGLNCASGRCVKLMGIGGSCRDPWWRCRRGLTCNARKICSPRVITVGLGGLCSRFGFRTRCAHGLSCLGNRCIKVVGYRQKCALPNVVCARGQGLGCVGPRGRTSCKKLMGIGGSCADPWWVCQPSLQCVREGHKKICRAPKW